MPNLFLLILLVIKLKLKISSFQSIKMASSLIFSYFCLFDSSYGKRWISPEILQFLCLFMDSIIKSHKYSMILQTCVNFFKSFTIFDSLNGKPVFFLAGILKFLDLFHCILAYFSLLLVLVLIQEEWYSFPCIFGMPSMPVILHKYLQCRIHNLTPCLLGVLQNIQCYCSCCLTRSYKLTYFF